LQGKNLPDAILGSHDDADYNNGVTRGLEEAITSKFIFGDDLFGKLMFGRVIGR